jgi:hypothetical protein
MWMTTLVIETFYQVAVIQCAGLITFDHRRTDPMDHNWDLPIDILTLDDHGELVTD